MPLVAELPPEPDGELVMVFESSDNFAISLAKSALEEASIPYWVQGDEPTLRRFYGTFVLPTCRFQVAREDEAEARALLEPLLFPMEDDPKGTLNGEGLP